MRSAPIFFSHPALQSQAYQRRLLRATARVLRSGCFLEGPENAAFCAELSAFFNHKNITLVASGHDALSFALLALHLHASDEVIFPANAYPTAFPVFQTHCKPVLVDVDVHGQLNLDALAQKISPKTQAVIMVHMYGFVGKMYQVRKLLRQKSTEYGHPIYLIEDCAQAFGTRYRGQLVGTFGDIACFSFYPTKNLGTLGDGGALLTKHRHFHDFFQQAKRYGEKERYRSEFCAGHSRLPEIQAAILRTYLTDFSKNAARRQKVMAQYHRGLAAADLPPHVQFLETKLSTEIVPHLCILRVGPERDHLQHFLKRHAIETLIHYPYPVHQVPAFARQMRRRQRYPMAEILSLQILSVPFHQYLTTQQIRYIFQAIQEYYRTQYEKAASAF